MVGAVFVEHIRNGNLLPVVGSVVTFRADVDAEGDHHVDLGLVYGL